VGHNKRKACQVVGIELQSRVPLAGLRTFDGHRKDVSQWEHGTVRKAAVEAQG